MAQSLAQVGHMTVTQIDVDANGDQRRGGQLVVERAVDVIEHNGRPSVADQVQPSFSNEIFDRNEYCMLIIEEAESTDRKCRRLSFFRA